MRIEEEIKQTKPFKSPQIKAVVNLAFTASWLTGIQNKFIKPFGISMQQFNILKILKGMHPEPATVKVLIERMIDKNSNASRLVDKLLAKGLVERSACANDRRRVDVMITEAGLEMITAIETSKEGSLNRIGLTDEEALTLSDLLDKMRE